MQPQADVVDQLAMFFARNGYVRRQNADRFEREGSSHYKKGTEVRLVAESLAELNRIGRLLRAAGFNVGRPFRKHKKYCQPIYGREQVDRFLRLVGTRL